MQACKLPPEPATVYDDAGAAHRRSGIPMNTSRQADDFEQVVFPHLNAAYNLARWLLRDSQDAEDVVHDSFLRANRYFASFRGGDARAWLLGIVRNTCMTRLRERKSATPLSAPDIPEPFDRAARNPEQSLLLKESIDALKSCIEALPAEYREVLVLRELEEFSYQQISETTGAASGTVMSRLSRARKRLSDCVAKKVGALV
jgi:RNA polymerase sigma-70 factor (ECF subfamily)